MSDFQDRLKVEQTELYRRTSNLQAFIYSPKFAEISTNQRRLMTTQLGAMRSYLTTLRQRMVDLGIPFSPKEMP